MPNIDFESGYGRLGTALLNFWKLIEATALKGKRELNELIGELNNISICSTEKPKNTDTLVKLFNAALLNANTPKKSLNRFNRTLVETNPYIHWYPDNLNRDKGKSRKVEYYCTNIVGGREENQGSPFLFYSSKILVGLFLLGSNELYHKPLYPASRMWVVLSGKARWKGGTEEEVVRKPGEYFIQTSTETHAIETMDEPLLAMWACTINP